MIGTASELGEVAGESVSCRAGEPVSLSVRQWAGDFFFGMETVKLGVLKFVGDLLTKRISR
jgi:hypothetical protein